MSEGAIHEPRSADVAQDPLNQICAQMAGAFRRVWGRGPVRTSAHWAGPNMLLVVLENGHTDQEKALRATGHIQQLVEGRQLLQHILEDELTSIVESATRREVATMLSATRLDPDLSAEIFLLTPTRSSEPAKSTATRAAEASARAHELIDQAAAVSAQAQQAHLRTEARRGRPDQPRPEERASG